MSTHHKMGMSRWTPWAVCPHFDSVEHSASAARGSALHDKLARLLNEDTTVEIDLTQMTDRAVAWAADVIKANAKEAGNEPIYSEEMVEIRDAISEQLSGIYGTVDAFFVEHSDDSNDVIHVFDFKSLSQGDKGDLWPQLMGYALGVASMLGVSQMNTKCVLHILHGGCFRHDVKKTTLFDCLTVGETVVNSRKHCEAAKHTPSEWCKYCKHSTCCEATDEQIELVRKGVLNSLTIPTRLILIEQLEGILKKAKEEAKAEIALADGKRVADDNGEYAITETNGPSSLVKGSMLALHSMMAERGVDAEAFFDVCKIGKSDAMKLLQKTGLKLKSKDPDAVTAESLVSQYFKANTVEKLERVR